MTHHVRRVAGYLCALAGALFLCAALSAQQPVALPYTMTTIGGGLVATPASGAYCPGSTTVKASNSYGDGCAAVAAKFGSGGRGGVAVDSYGNVFVSDDSSTLVQMIDPNTGVMSLVAGGGNKCSGAVDELGDGCVAATQTKLKSSRGIATDPYGNVLLAGYNDNAIHLVCRAASPLCVTGTPSPTAANPIQIQVGYMGLVAGCMKSSGSAGVGAPGLDNTPGFTTYSNAVAAFQNGGSCSASLGEADQPRGVGADIYGNVYYADTNTSRTRVVLGPLTSPYFSGNNPLYAALKTHWANPIAGYVYTVVNEAGTSTSTGGTPTTTGASCSDNNSGTTYTGTATDIRGDGCPYWLSSVNANGGNTNDAATDAAGNMVFTDPGNGNTILGGLRVLFVQGWATAADAASAGATGSVATAGVAMYNAIKLNNPGVTPQPGFLYALAGGSGMQASPSGSSLSATPVLGNNVQIPDSQITKVTLSPQGNIYIGDNTRVLFFDIYTGTIRTLLSSSGKSTTAGAYCNGTSGAVATSAFGDGCPASATGSYAEFGNGNGLGIAVDGEGNLYMYDGSSYGGGMLVREVLAQGMGVQSSATLAALSTVSTAYPQQSLGAVQTQIFEAHFPSTTAAPVTLTNSTNSNLTYGAPACTSNSDGSADCTVAVTYTPTATGLQSAAMTLAVPGEQMTLGLGSTVTGPALAVDQATSGGTSVQATATLLSGHTPAALAVDGAGNVYEASGTSILEAAASSPSTTKVVASSLSAAPAKLALDQGGDIYYVNGTSSIQALMVNTAGAAGTGTYSSISISYTPSNLGTADPVALAMDAANNLLVADEQNSVGTIYRVSPSATGANSQTNCSYPKANSTAPTLCQSAIATTETFGVISAMTVDSAGNIYVADNSAVYKLVPSNGVYAGSTVVSGGGTTGLATDAAGDLYVQSGSTVTMYPVSGASSVVVTSGATTPSGVAVDGMGNVYVADAAAGSVTEVQRGTLTENFGSDSTLQFAATLTNIGNQASAAQTATTSTGAQAGDFALNGGASSGCVFNNSLLAGMSAGQSCTLTATFPALGNAQETDYIVLAPVLPATSSSGMLTLTGLANAEAFDTTTAIGAASTTSPSYAVSGTEVSFPITVTASATSTDNSVTNNTNGPTTADYATVSVDAGASTNYYFTSTNGLSATLTLNLSGLTAGPHSFKVTFPQQGALLESSATSGIFTIGQVTTAVTWTPASNTQQVSAALGTAVLNPTISPVIDGSFVYSTVSSPSCTATNVPTVDASTYLPVGSYTIYATFCPADSADYVSSTSSISYTVTKADTTAAVGASTMVVAPQGGNFTKLSDALSALPPTGGTIYVAPGTYNEQDAISYPNVQLRGLGGDPTQVILSGENGAFRSGSVPTGFTMGPAGKGGDEGSATLDVSKNAFMGTQALTSTYTPNNFYAENLTIQNTYDTDSTTTSMYKGSCQAGGTAATLESLYNSSNLCGSQALALYINSDGAVLNNVNLVSAQDTLYASSIGCGTYCTVAREYFWKGLIVGNVDYVFGDAALVFDHTNFFTTWHGTSAGGTETIEAQNKRFATGTTPATSSSNSTSQDYLSGFICNACTLLSQSPGMTKLYYGRPWDISTSNYPSSYSTWIMLNSYVDQVNPGGWVGWDGNLLYLNTATYGEYNTQAYTDPSVGTAPYPYALFNSTPSVLYTADASDAGPGSLLPAGGNDGSYGVTATSSTPANREQYAIGLTAAGAAQYYPVAFLSTPVPSSKLASGQSAQWNPVGALASLVNGFVPVASVGALTAGSSVTILGRPQTPGAGVVPTGTYSFYDSLNNNQACSSASSSCTVLATGSLDGSGEAYLTTSSLASGTHYITMVYGGDNNFNASTSGTYSIYVLENGQTATTTSLFINNTSSTVGTPISGTVTVAPTAAAGVVNISLDGAPATTCTLANGACAWSISGATAGTHTILANYAGDSSYGLSASATVTVSVTNPVATGDSRTVAEPSFPAGCQQLTATLTTDPAIQDLDASVDANNSNIDGARIQAALNACSATAVAANTNMAVELSADSTGAHNAFLSGPLTMPSNVTLLVDPNVTLYFSRNVQDYDMVPGTHTCGTINSSSNTKSCQPLIDIPGTSTNVGVMGYGKLNGRGGDPLLNGFATSGFQAPATYTWWSLASQADGEGNQQNPRFIQMDKGASNITLYKITILNSPNFHVSTTGAVTGFTAWDVKIVTPTTARNTDGIDPANLQNGTITQSWISDGDDNVAVSAPGTTAPAKNITVTNNHFYAGHGESIGSYTGAGVSNILFDGNMAAGNAWAGYGSAALTGVADGNSTAVRIKTANDRGGLVTNIQYSNSCFLDHKDDIQFTPYYSSGDSTNLFPSYTGILMQNLVFENDASSQGLVELTGEYNTNSGAAVVNPLTLTMDNVSFPSTLSSLVNSTTPVESSSAWGNGNSSGGTGQYVNLTVGPGQVSGDFLTAYNALVANSANNDTLNNKISLTSLNPPACTFTYLAPELTGPTGMPETITYGQPAALDVILTPTVGGAPYPTGTVTLTDSATSNTFTGTFTGVGDTLAVTIPALDLTAGSHTFSVTAYANDPNYQVPTSYQTFGSYAVTVSQATPTVTLTSNINPSAAGAAVTFTATLPSDATGTVSFMNGSTTLTSGVAVSNGTATYTTSSLVASTTAYQITAVYSGDTNYTSATSNAVAQLVNGNQVAISWTPAASITYGTPLSAELNATASFNSTPVSGTFAFTAAPAGGTAGPVTGATVLGAGSYTLTATFTPADLTLYAQATATAKITVGQATPAIVLSSSLNPVLLDNAVTFTAKVSGTGGTPTGTVNFLDGTTVIGAGTLSGGAASFSSAALTVGAHSITASYSGDTNFTAATSSVLAQSVITITIGSPSSGSGGTGSGSGSSQTITPGGTASFSLPIVPSTGTSFPTPLTLSITGLPAGATASLTPNVWVQSTLPTTVWTLPANTPIGGNTVINITLPKSTMARLDGAAGFGAGLGPLALGMLLLPFSSRFRRRSRQLHTWIVVVVLLIAGLGAFSGLVACGGSSSQTGKTYPVTVTVASGPLSTSTQLSITVQ
ncbi:MAG: pectinesterase family protein [Acidobacteriota bacterium]